MHGHLYRICDAQTWAQAEGLELLPLSPLDERDGFVHLSTATQVRDTLRRFFAGRDDLVLLTISSARLINGSLRYEPPSRPDAELVAHAAEELFPHFYARVPLDAIVSAQPLPLDERGVHRLPLALTRAISNELDDHGSIELRVGWDQDQHIAHIEYSRPVQISDEAGLYAWEATLERQLGDFVARRGGRVAAVIGIDNLSVSPKLERRYAELADKVISRWFGCVARWSANEGHGRFFARANDARALPSEVFTSRADAVAHVSALRRRAGLLEGSAEPQRGPRPCSILSQ